MATFGVEILGAGRSLQVVRANAYSDHPSEGNTHGSQAKREHWLTGGVGDVPSDVPAWVTLAALTASAMASPRPAATIRRLAAFSLVLIVALLLSQVSTPASKVWMGSQAPRPRLHRLHQFGRRAVGQAGPFPGAQSFVVA